jgi:hypothetical protein
MISDVLFLCLVGICIYIILDTMIQKNILNFGKFKVYKNKNFLHTKEFSKKESIKIESNKSLKNHSKTSSSYIEKLTENENQNMEIFEKNQEGFQTKFISEDTEDLIDEVINQNNEHNEIILQN